ncbi:MAG TPA: flagellar motor protein MotB [Stellaceae bacterium]|nr:flagellar motor protein MotB [Stellaceae bacterium]
MEHKPHPRRRRHEDRHENHERWIISYADFMTLLFATFVMLYAISSVNTSKYRILQQVFAEAFLGKMVHEDAGLQPQKGGVFDHLSAPVPVPQRNISPQLQNQIEQRIRQLEKIYDRLTNQFQGLIQKDLVHVVRQPNGVVIDINATLLFTSGSAALTPQALTILDQVGKALVDVPYIVQVNGFTDDAPIHNGQFDSNWDLSATRAISVVKRFVADGIAPDRLVGAGYGEYHPVAPNDSLANMARNRRVSIIVIAPNHEATMGGVPVLGGTQPPAAESDAVSVPPTGATAAPGAPAPAIGTHP